MKNKKINGVLIITLLLVCLYSCGNGKHVSCDAYGKTEIKSQTENQI